MIWEPWTSHALRSPCHKYSISKAFVRGEKVYTLWKLPAKRLGNFKELEAAKAKLTK
jgi:hypothetical protein